MKDDIKRALWRSGALAVVAGTALAASPALAAPTTIVAQHSNKCLDVRGGPTATGDGALIEQWSCTGQSNQAWTLTDKGQGQYQLAASSSGKCVEVINGATGNGAGIQQATCSGLSKQLWRLNSKGSGRYEVVAVNGGRCLDVTGGPTATGDGVLTELWDCTGEANQAWTLTPPTAPPPQSTAKPLVAKHSGKCLDVRGGVTAVSNGDRIDQYACTGLANQDWTLKDMGGGQYEIIARSSGKCMETINGGTANLTGIQQWDCTGLPRQLWNMQSAGATGEYRFVHVPSGRCLDVTGGPTATGDGVLMELWDCTGEANQTWTVGTPTTPPPTNTSGPYGQDASQYTLYFNEEFDGSTLDTGKWTDHLWYQPADSTPNYVISNGSLKIFPVAGTSYVRDYRHITTDGKYYQTYGYFEMEAKLPYGRGPWPAFWLYNHDQPDPYRPEIDIMEAYPGGGPNSGWSNSSLRPTAYGATIWTGWPEEQGGYKMVQAGTDLSAGYHRYGLKWEANRQSFYLDGNLVYTTAVSMPERMYILLSFQFGSASGAGDSTTPTGQGNAFDVRYVRAWKFK
ncbi:RICIN domain-containing protein [Pyxidicoccus caerfyrddinensis]|uniref:RICIN domain-containing protein n=1 Tax=Pyxidicoccus caerfyrddinensis TaxID=2709663 RepID=UPI0013D94161|nr:RICIN domain-containing protein [Pyxidicoccus caerfyrddinensis]